MGDVVNIRDYQTREEQAIKLNRLANRVFAELPTIELTDGEMETIKTWHEGDSGDCA